MKPETIGLSQQLLVYSAWICSEWQTLADANDPRMTRFLTLLGSDQAQT